MMNSTAGDLSLFFKVVHGKLAGLTGAYVDDTLGAGGEGFEMESLMTQEKFESKPREYDDFVFAGIQMEKTEDGFLMHQERYALKVELLRKDSTFSDFRSKRQELPWLANTRPDIAASVNLASQVTEGKWSADDVKHINGLVKYVKGNPRRSLLQQRLDLNTLSLRVFTDSSFANTPDLSSQLGILILLCDATGKCNVLHFASYKSKRVVRSVMGAETYAFADGFDFAYLLKNDIEAWVGKRVPLTIMTDSESLFKIIVKNSTTTEKRLTIDIKGVRDAYDAQEISDVGWVNGGDNPADGLTKKERCDALERLLDTGRLDVEVQQWVVRTPRSDS